MPTSIVKMPKNCERCGGEFAPYVRSQRFCSDDCRYPKRNCEVCEKEFRPAKGSTASITSGRFCGDPCKNIWKKTRFAGENNPSWKGGKLSVCQVCEVQFPDEWYGNKCCPEHRWDNLRQIAKGRTKQKNPNYKDGRSLPVTKVCQICEKEFVGTQASKYCDRDCRQVGLLKSGKTKDTSIELAIGKWLEEHALYPVQRQVHFKGIGIVDFLVGTTVWECDGVYWHTMPGSQEHDKKRDAALNALGLTVIRLSDEEIKKVSLDDLMKIKSIVATFHNQQRVPWFSRSFYEGLLPSVPTVRKFPSLQSQLLDLSLRREETA